MQQMKFDWGELAPVIEVYRDDNFERFLKTGAAETCDLLMLHCR